MLAILLLLSYPFIEFKGVFRKISIASHLRFHSPKNGRNIVFAVLAIVEFVVFYWLFRLFDGAAQAIYSIPFEIGRAHV